MYIDLKISRMFGNIQKFYLRLIPVITDTLNSNHKLNASEVANNFSF